MSGEECVRAGQLKPKDVSNLVAKIIWQAICWDVSVTIYEYVQTLLTPLVHCCVFVHEKVLVSSLCLPTSSV